MDEEMLGNIILVVVILLFMLGSIFIRRRSVEKTELGRIVALLSEINQKLKLIDTFTYSLRVKKFQTGTWKRSKTELDFLDERLQTTLANTFGMAEEFNQEIDAARKHKSSSYLAGIQVNKLKEPLTKCQQELGEWLEENKDEKELFPKKRGLFS